MLVFIIHCLVSVNDSIQVKTTDGRYADYIKKVKNDIKRTLYPYISRW